MRNVILDAFETEEIVSFPILIDFGQAEQSPHSEHYNTKSFHLFLKYCYCCNPMRDTNWIFGNIVVPYESFTNLTEAKKWVMMNF